jgi:hypothetical protein
MLSALILSAVRANLVFVAVMAHLVLGPVLPCFVIASVASVMLWPVLP